MTPVPRLKRRGRAPLVVLAAIVLVLAGTVTGCGQKGGAATAPPASDAAPLLSPVVGVPIDIDTEGFSKVTAFTIRTAGGREITFTMGTLENGAAFPPNHLAEHLAASTQVRVFFRDEDGRPVVHRLEDAEPAP